MRKCFLALSALACFNLSALADPKDTPAQLDDFRSCGLTSYYTTCYLLGLHLSWRDAQAALGPPNADGIHTFAQLQEAGRKVGLTSRGFFIDSRHDAVRLPTPAIVQAKFAHGKAEPHFLVLVRASEEGVVLLDPPFPAFRLSWEDFEKVWSGHALAFRQTGAGAELDSFASSLELPWTLRLASAVVAAALIALVFRVRWRFPRFARVAAARSLPIALVACAVLGVAAGVHLGFGRSRQPIPPTLDVGEEVVNLGTFDRGRRSVTFVIRNTGDTDLTIEKVFSTCTCASIRPPASVPPHGEAEVGADLNVLAGPGSAVLRFQTNDPSGMKAIRLVWQGLGDPILSPAVISGSETPATAVRKLVAILFPGGPGTAAPVFRGLRCDSNLVRVRPLGIEAPRGPDAAGLERRSALVFEVMIDPPGHPIQLATDANLLVSYGGQSLEYPLRIFIVYRSEIAPAVDSVLFSARRPGGLVGQSRRVAIFGADDPSDLRVGRAPAWLRHAFVRSPAGGVALDLQCIALPPADGVPVKLSITSVRHPETTASVAIEAFAAGTPLEVANP